MNRVGIINSLIKKNNYKSYLEIGVRTGDCFNAIECEDKIGVDPDLSSAATHLVTSDEFFKNSIKMFDIIFIDGLHHSDQVIKDVQNALEHLTDKGTIVMHDCLPYTEKMQEIPLRPDHDEWTGDTWKAFVHYRRFNSELTMNVVDTDYGCGIIQKKPANSMLIILDEDITYNNFTKYKLDWMNVISVGDFMKKYLV